MTILPYHNQKWLPLPQLGKLQWRPMSMKAYLNHANLFRADFPRENRTRRSISILQTATIIAWFLKEAAPLTTAIPRSLLVSHLEMWAYPPPPSRHGHVRKVVARESLEGNRFRDPSWNHVRLNSQGSQNGFKTPRTQTLRRSAA